ncbi:DUF479 domain-containing protein [Vibrio metoecus]|uniref:ACP phosphodiesterase n=1 Tax=Vibrio metoecus TaxID=1481663 RepID=A0ABR4RY24_VIBMT|nr:ACP phosphodiesterase [Vibrio metoecus]KDO14190.1 ACP phosphodiesterase [Vibrio metoecus]KQA98818.1 ACP phosphodiesterase [Vibrio metoecus]MCR9387225.1 ACP phosphodiesterase [Vibrio metoecus]PAR27987.1 DUF479 domain-containing protein [Vibrio metoecus]PAR40667.1 DUF479 domain-containing protein [Vibrio metoecus]
MNFLAHLHIAHHCQSSLLGNLLGDFVKGDPTNQYPQSVVQGIRLHRWVDAYTDSHPVMKASKLLFPNPQQRFAPIALDLFWDHCLVNTWSSWHSEPLTQFLTRTRQGITAESTVTLPERFERVNTAMWQGQWLESYAEFDNIRYALSRMALRSERMQPLVHSAEALEANYAALQAQFNLLYHDVLEKAKRRTL